MENAFILALFIAAMSFIGKRVWNEFKTPKTGCFGACTKCSALEKNVQ